MISNTNFGAKKTATYLVGSWWINSSRSLSGTYLVITNSGVSFPTQRKAFGRLPMGQGLVVVEMLSLTALVITQAISATNLN